MWNSTFPTFTKHTIASFNAGYALAVVDIDHDGKQDVVALSSGAAGLVWFKNPSWAKYTITTTAKQLIFTAPYDVNGDGNVDLALISDFDMNDTTGGGTVSWAEAPSDPTKNSLSAEHRYLGPDRLGRRRRRSVLHRGKGPRRRWRARHRDDWRQSDQQRRLVREFALNLVQ